MTNPDTESRFFRWSTERVLQYRWLMLALLVAISVAAGVGASTSLMVDNSTEYFAGGDAEVSGNLESFRDDFGRDDYFFVLVEGDVFSVPFLTQLSALHEALEAADLEVESLGERRAVRQARLAGRTLPEAEPELDDFGSFGEDDGWGEEAGGTLIEEVTSLVNFRQTLFEDGAVRVHGLLDAGIPTESELPALKEKVLSNPAMVGNIIGPRATHTVLLVRTQFMNEDDSARVNTYLGELSEGFEKPGFAVSVTGITSLNQSLNGAVVKDTAVLFSLAAVVMGIVLIALFRRVVPVIAPLAVVGLSGLWTLGMMSLVGAPMTIVSSIIPAFLVCVGLGDSIHILAVHRDEVAKGVGGREAMVRAIATTGVPVMFTTATTMAGLASFKFASAPAIQEMGLAGAFGVFAALVNSLVLLPILISFQPELPGVAARSERPPDRIDRFLERCRDLSVGRGLMPTLLGGVLLVAIAAGGMSLLSVYHNPLSWLGEDHPTTIGITTMDKEVGGISSVQVVFDTESEHGVKDLELLRAIEDLAEALETYEHPVTHERIVSGSVSLVDIVKETNRALHGGDPDQYVLPDDQRAVSDALLLFESAGPEELARIATADLKRSHLSVRVKWMDATSYTPFRQFIDEQIERTIGDKAKVVSTGGLYTILSVIDSLISDLIRSFSVAVVVITLMMIALLRDIKLGLISMVPNLLPIATILGFMGYVGIPIDMSNLVIASIIIGIAVDDTIHFLHQYRVGYQATGSTETAIRLAMDHAGRAMVSTTAVLTLGFSVFIASSLGSIQRFGLLIGLACCVALLMDLVLAPALLRFFIPDRSSQGPDHVSS